MPHARHRRRFQGVENIVRFNAPAYVAAAAVVVFGLVVAVVGAVASSTIVVVGGVCAAALAGVLSLGSLVGSWAAYDSSDLYSWQCLQPFVTDDVKVVAHVHTGLDESTDVFAALFVGADVLVFDASAPHAQPAPSIVRARRLVPLHPATIPVGLGPLPVLAASVQLLILPMAAHEVAAADIRANWLRQLAVSLSPQGRMLVIEHLRDLPNTLAFHVGVLHFLSARTWRTTFAAAGLDVVESRRVAPLLQLFVLARCPQ